MWRRRPSRKRGGIDTKYPPNDIQRYLVQGLTSDISAAHVRFHGLSFFSDEEPLTKAELRDLAEDQLRFVALGVKDDRMAALRVKMVAMNLVPEFIAMFDRAWDWRKAVRTMTKAQIVVLRNDYASRPSSLSVHKFLIKMLDVELQ